MPSLTPDQEYGARFLANNRVAYLADVPGLGKTAQYISALDRVRTRSAIIVCPPVLRRKLQAEADLWSVWGYDLTPIESRSDYVPAEGIVVPSYALASDSILLDALAQRVKGPVIFDEAHALKGFGSLRTRACLGILAHCSTALWFVSGTPMPNHAEELFPFAVLAGLWRGSRKDFINEFCTVRPDRYDPSGYKISGSKNLEQLRALLGPRFLRRTVVEGRPPLATDVIPIEGTDHYASLAPDERELIQTALLCDDWSFQDLDAMSTVRRLTGVAKVKGTIDLARQEMESGHKRLLVFGNHTETLRAITDGLKDLGAELINGSTSDKHDERVTDAFQRDDGANRIIVGNMQTLGEGVTLHAASRVLIAEPSWVPKDNTQVIARAWRRGQKRPVHASFLSLAGSIDDAITRVVERKSKQIDSVMG